MVELLIATAIGSVIAAGLAQLILYSGRSFATMANYVSLDRARRNTLNTMTKQIRQTRRLLECSETKLTFQDSDGGTLIFKYSSEKRALTRVKDGTSDVKPLLTECDYFRFSIFQRTPIGGSYEVCGTPTAATCKGVQLSWACSREIFGFKLHTESVQSARIVIRKQ